MPVAPRFGVSAVLRGCISLLVLGMCLSMPPAMAWNDHPLGTRPALAQLPEVANAPDVEVETFLSFVQKEEKGLETLLKEEEAWARANFTGYPARPDAIAFQAQVEGASSALPVDVRLLRALRWNPTVKLALFLENVPGSGLENRPALSWEAVTILKEVGRMMQTPYVSISAGEKVKALDVAVTASDEPDFGLDINVWEDSPSDFGPQYGFGKLPFGNRKLEYATQAPFHMGLYHEAGIVYTLASFTKRTYPEVRIRQCLALARYAFKTGHDYWGWRFTGWGLHYMQDLTMPYHASLLPGVSVARMLTINTLGMIGIKGPVDNAVQLVTNRHLALENYQYSLMAKLGKEGKQDHPVLLAAANGSQDASYGPFTPAYPREVLSLESKKIGKKTDKVLVKALPKKLVSDPKYLFEQTEPDINVCTVVEAGPARQREALDGLMSTLFQHFGAHSRNFVRAVRQ